MKPVYKWTLATVAVAVFGMGSALWWLTHQAARAASTPTSEPVAQVTVEFAKRRVLFDTLSGFGEVSAGPLAGLSFQRAGQVTRISGVPGDRVVKGATLATLVLDPTARETYLQATNALAVARREADRLRQLLVLQLATQSQVDTAEKAALDAAGSVKALDAQGGSSIGSTLVAPFDGVVTTVPVAQGDRVQPGATILQLARSDALRVQIGIDPAQSRRVKPGTQASLEPIVSPGDKSVAIDARVSSIQDIVDPKTQLISAIVTLPRQASGQLVPGMRVRASLQVGSLSAIAVPRNSVLSDGQGDYVFQVDKGKAKRVPVTKQLESGGYVAIAGLDHPELPVVVVGNYVLEDGMAVKEVAQ